MNIDKLSCDDTSKYISLLKEYINMLDKELKETSPLAYVKGWRSTQVEYGVELRKKLNVYDKSFDAEPTRWKRYRFYTKHLDDFRPLIFNQKYPWWCSATGDNYAVIVAYLPYDEELTKYWDDAHKIHVTGEDEIVFSGRFPRPDYFIES